VVLDEAYITRSYVVGNVERDWLLRFRGNSATPSPINDTADIAFVVQEDILAMQVLVLDGKRALGVSHPLCGQEMQESGTLIFFSASFVGFIKDQPGPSNVEFSQAMEGSKAMPLSVYDGPNTNRVIGAIKIQLSNLLEREHFPSVRESSPDL
jgi:hypothetical protein